MPIRGAVKLLSEPSGLRRAEPSGSAHRVSSSSPRDHGPGAGEEAAAVVGRQLLHLRHLVGVAVDRRVLQPRLDDAVGQVPADADDEERRDGGEPEVAKGVDHPLGVEDLGRLLGEPLQQGVDARGDEVGREPARDPREGGRDAGQRMPPRCVEDDPAQGDDEHVAGVGRGVADDGGQDEHRGQQARRRPAQDQLEAGVDEAGLLGHPDPEQRHQHHPQRREPGEGGHELHQERGEGGARQLVGDSQRLAAARVDLGELDRGQDRRRDPRQHQQQQEQDGRVRQPVADGLDGVQGAVYESPALGACLPFRWCLRHGLNLSRCRTGRCGSPRGRPSLYLLIRLRSGGAFAMSEPRSRSNPWTPNAVSRARRTGSCTSG